MKAQANMSKFNSAALLAIHLHWMKFLNKTKVNF